jgi:hypothetical protein
MVDSEGKVVECLKDFGTPAPYVPGHRRGQRRHAAALCLTAGSLAVRRYDVVPPFAKHCANTSSLSCGSPVVLRNCGEPISCVNSPVTQPAEVQRL